MIDFRYHLVSIIAVFLALAVGIFVGSTALKGTTVAVLNRTANRVTAQNKALIQRNKTLGEQITFDENFARTASGQLLPGLLTGHSVVIVTAPGADSATVSGVTADLRKAGATVTGQVNLTNLFFDTSASTEDELTSLAGQNQEAGSSPGTGSQFSGQQAAAAALAPALVTRSDAVLTPATSTGGQATVQSFSQRNYLQLAGSTASALQPAQLAVVIPPASAPTSNDSSPDNQILLLVAQALRAAGHGVVLAGSLPGSGQGSAIDALASGALTASVSTVDNADTQTGQIVTAWALAELLAGHKATAYGVLAGTVPSPAPAPSATASTSPSPGASGSASRSKHGKPPG